MDGPSDQPDLSPCQDPRIPGFYIASHPWLDAEQLIKVGQTSDLRRRIYDGSYTTGFTPGWRYHHCLLTATAEEAECIEYNVLAEFNAKRIPNRELVRETADAILDMALLIAMMFGITVEHRRAPVWDCPARPGGSTPAAAGGLPAPTVALPAPTVAVVPTVLAPAVPAVLAVPVVPTAPPTPAPTVVPAVLTDDLSDFDEMLVEDAAVEAIETFELRDYQNEAVRRCWLELEASGRTLLQMACRCGKTPVAAGIIERHAAAAGNAPAAAGNVPAAVVVLLVPGLALLRQTAQKLYSYGLFRGGAPLLVGSDPRPVPVAGAQSAGMQSAACQAPTLLLSMTTDPAAVSQWLAQRALDLAAGQRGPHVIISTYQSSSLVPLDAGLVIFDEAHRCCGGSAPRPFNHHLVGASGRRLYMTATPAYDQVELTMRDRSLFGGVAYRYHLRRGIEAGYVNDFRLELVVGYGDEATAMPGLIREAVQRLGAGTAASTAMAPKLLVFCRSIEHLRSLEQALTATAGELAAAPLRVYSAHSRSGDRPADVLRRFAQETEPAVLLNCRMFQEGVEIPTLTGIFFAAPRHSPRDIIQSLCRPLNAVPGKPQSVVFVPVVLPPMVTVAATPAVSAATAVGPTVGPAELKRFATIVPFVDALLDEDPALYEHLLDPAGHKYNLGLTVVGAGVGVGVGTVVDVSTAGASLAGAGLASAYLTAARRVIRYGLSVAARPVERLLRVENVPWDKALAEIRRCVHTCGRYPKTTDAWHVGDAVVCLYRFYRAAAEAWTDWRAGRPSRLEPHQLRDLAELPGWEPYGVEGPYPWGLCMQWLEGWLEGNGGAPPPIEINKGGYIGLDATMMERLSGALTCVNQQTFGVKLSKASAAADKKAESAVAAKMRRLGRDPIAAVPMSASERSAATAATAATTMEEAIAAGTDASFNAPEGSYTALAEVEAPSSPDPAVDPAAETTRAPLGTNRVPADHQRDLDRICQRFGLRWRKVFRPDGTVDETAPTFIQDAYERFKQMYKRQSPADLEYIRTWFPGYPHKHAKQESLEVQAAGTAPARYKAAKQAGAATTATAAAATATAAAAATTPAALVMGPPRAVVRRGRKPAAGKL